MESNLVPIICLTDGIVHSIKKARLLKLYKIQRELLVQVRAASELSKYLKNHFVKLETDFGLDIPRMDNLEQMESLLDESIGNLFNGFKDFRKETENLHQTITNYDPISYQLWWDSADYVIKYVSILVHALSTFVKTADLSLELAKDYRTCRTKR